MNTYFKILSALCDYPTPQLIAHLPEINQAAQSLPKRQKKSIGDFLAVFEKKSLNDLQESYVATFDRGAVPLHLFHYVHGDSKDRGTAMVRLKAQYQEAGLIFGVDSAPDNSDINRELPDALCVYLEYLSALPPKVRAQAASEVAHLINAMAGALRDLGSVYFYLLAELARTAGAPLEEDGLPPFALNERASLLSEKIMEEVDALWQEAPAFDNASCQPASASSADNAINRLDEQPLSFFPRAPENRATTQQEVSHVA